MSNSSGKVFRGFILVFLIATPILIITAAAVFWFILDSPSAEHGNVPGEIIVGSGDNISTVSEKLENNGLIDDRRYISLRFKFLSRLGLVPPIQSGRYSLNYGQKPSEIIKNLTSPLESQRVYTTLTIPPGLTSTVIAARVEEAGLAYSEDVMKAILDLASDYPVKPNPEGLQGYMFPDTYKIETPIDRSAETSRKTAESVVRIMSDSFFTSLNEIDPFWQQLTASQLHEKVTLASIVEREYRRKEEAPMIAAVFNNRMKEGMPLQSCATVVYTIEETDTGKPFRSEYLQFNRRIFERYLDISSPYNTYYDSGLPPGPISAPSRTALDAAFYPADTDALFFVVKDPEAGTHTFTRDYNDHLDAREAYLNQYVVKD